MASSQSLTGPGFVPGGAFSMRNRNAGDHQHARQHAAEGFVMRRALLAKLLVQLQQVGSSPSPAAAGDRPGRRSRAAAASCFGSAASVLFEESSARFLKTGR